VLEENDSLAAESASEEDEDRAWLESSARLAGAGCFAVLARLRRVVRRIPLAGFGRVMRY